MDACCGIHTVQARQRRVLTIVLLINAAMFMAECLAALLAHSTALLADSVDMLGDAVVYGFSLYVVGRGPEWQARGARLKGGLMAVFGLAVLVEVGTKLARGFVPRAELMGAIGVVALVANAACLALLWRHRSDDVNMQSVWLCSRNDVAANGGVLVGALGVALTASAWPDIVVGLLIAALFTRSAIRILRLARRAAGPLRMAPG
jgi:Co/Zn/Cd efflux system component